MHLLIIIFDFLENLHSKFTGQTVCMFVVVVFFFFFSFIAERKTINRKSEKPFQCSATNRNKKSKNTHLKYEVISHSIESINWYFKTWLFDCATWNLITTAISVLFQRHLCPIYFIVFTYFACILRYYSNLLFCRLPFFCFHWNKNEK